MAEFARVVADRYVWARAAAVGLLLAAIAPWPYDYYTVMRLVVCIVTARGAYLAYERARTASTELWKLKQQRWMWTFGAIALAFNPFLPIHLDRTTWAFIDIGVAVVIFLDLKRDVRAHRARR